MADCHLTYVAELMSKTVDINKWFSKYVANCQLSNVAELFSETVNFNQWYSRDAADCHLANVADLLSKTVDWMMNICCGKLRHLLCFNLKWCELIDSVAITHYTKK